MSIYLKRISEHYNPLQDNLIAILKTVNSYQSIYGFREFSDATIPCMNSSVNAIKDIKKINPDEVDSMLCAYMCYMDTLLNEAVSTIERYGDEFRAIFIGKVLTLKEKINARKTGNYLNKEPFMDSQKHVDRYYEIIDTIYNTNIIDDIDKVIAAFINETEKYASNGSPEERDIFIACILSTMRSTLEKLNMPKGIEVIDNYYEDKLKQYKLH